MGYYFYAFSIEINTGTVLGSWYEAEKEKDFWVKAISGRHLVFSSMQLF